MVDAQIINIGIIGDSLTGEILAEIRAVSANRLSQLLQGQVVLQVKLCVHAVLCQQQDEEHEFDEMQDINQDAVGVNEGIEDEQQVNGSNERHHSRYAIEDKEKYILSRYMFEKHRFNKYRSLLYAVCSAANAIRRLTFRSKSLRGLPRR